MARRRKRPPRRLVHRLRSPELLQRLGPGLITGAADDDPSGIATYSQAGAAFGLNMLWTVVLTYPFMTAVQAICARIGRVTGKGLAGNLVEVFPRPVVLRTVAPHRSGSQAVVTVVAVFGTTISPYLFFWESSEEVEEVEADDAARPLLATPRVAPAQLRRILLDNLLGMGVSNLIAFF